MLPFIEQKKNIWLYNRNQTKNFTNHYKKTPPFFVRLTTKHVQKYTFTVLYILLCFSYTFLYKKYTCYFVLRTMKGQVKRHPLHYKIVYIWKRPIVFSQRGSIQSIFVCVMNCYSGKVSKLFKAKFIVLRPIFGETYVIGNYQNGVLENRY